QLGGTDNLRQQSAMGQAMLMSAGLPSSKQILIQGFITSGGQKMSKSLGNIINPLDLVEKYGTDAVRYVLLRHTSPFEDSDLTIEAIHDHYTAHLTNGLGNLVARVMKLAETYNPAVNIFIQPAPSKVIDFKFNQALDEIWGEIKACDDLITTKEPFKLVKTNPEEGKRVISETINTLQKVAFMLQPFMPETSKRIQTAIEENKKPENLFPRL
ncbi:MAG: class I tRNA ligase family protein, partial [Patescibacteria group bacterium]